MKRIRICGGAHARLMLLAHTLVHVFGFVFYSALSRRCDDSIIHTGPIADEMMGND